MTTQEDSASQQASPVRKRGVLRAILRATLLVVLLAAAYLLLIPSPIDPAAFQPPAKPPLEGPLARNDRLTKAQIIGKAKVQGPEDVDVDDQGRIYAGTVDGKVLRILPDGTIETFADTGGRPLGLDFDPSGNLVVADAVRGLLSIDKQGKVTVLATEVDDVPFGFTDDVDVASDGTIYFSDASSQFGANEYLYDLLEAKPHGRLIAFDPKTNTARVLLDKLYFANGVALSQDEDFVLVNETYRYRIRRYWLKGPNQGQDDVFIDNLPGFPDGVSSNGKGTFWLALFTIRNDTMDRLHPHPFAKSLMAKLPKAMWPKPEPYGFVAQLNEQGEFVGSLQDPTGSQVREVTSAEEHDGWLYLGSLDDDQISKFKLP